MIAKFPFQSNKTTKIFFPKLCNGLSIYNLGTAPITIYAGDSFNPLSFEWTVPGGDMFSEDRIGKFDQLLVESDNVTFRLYILEGE